MNQVVPAKQMNAAEIAEAVLVKGDLAKLTSDERNAYYFRICESVGLNPLTKPFEYITLNGKLRLYALKDCTDQLRSVHNVSVTEMTEAEREGVFIVTCKVMNSHGRTDVSKGAVNIQGLKGENLANALMKAETKAKRRATLSICGLGMLDETEVEDIPAKDKQAVHVPSAGPVTVPSATAIEPPKTEAATPADSPDLSAYKVRMPRGTTAAKWSEAYIEMFMKADSEAELNLYDQANDAPLAALQEKHQSIYDETFDKYERHMGTVKLRDAERAATKADPISSGKPPKATKAKGGAPDIKAAYDKWLIWAYDQMANAKHVETLETFFNVMIEAERDDIFPPDFIELQNAYQGAEKRLTSE